MAARCLTLRAPDRKSSATQMRLLLSRTALSSTLCAAWCTRTSLSIRCAVLSIPVVLHVEDAHVHCLGHNRNSHPLSLSGTAKINNTEWMPAAVSSQETMLECHCAILWNIPLLCTGVFETNHNPHPAWHHSESLSYGCGCGWQCAHQPARHGCCSEGVQRGRSITGPAFHAKLPSIIAS